MAIEDNPQSLEMPQLDIGAELGSLSEAQEPVQQPQEQIQDIDPLLATGAEAPDLIDEFNQQAPISTGQPQGNVAQGEQAQDIETEEVNNNINEKIQANLDEAPIIEEDDPNRNDWQKTEYPDGNTVWERDIPLDQAPQASDAPLRMQDYVEFEGTPVQEGRTIEALETTGLDIFESLEKPIYETPDNLEHVTQDLVRSISVTDELFDNAKRVLDVDPKEGREYMESIYGTSKNYNNAIKDPEVANTIATKKLDEHLQKYGNNTNLALAALKMGSDKVDSIVEKLGTDSWDLVKPELDKEARAYVDMVKKYVPQASRLSKTKLNDQTPQLPEKPSLGRGNRINGNQGKNYLLAVARDSGLEGTQLQQFMAQMGHESLDFTRMEEIASGANYEGRSILGNTQHGDGVRYKGRGFIQLTGRDNYKRYGRMIGEDLVNNPELASDPEVAAKVALAYWNDRVAPKVSDFNDTVRVTRLINGGTNGLADRQRRFALLKTSLGTPTSGSEEAPVMPEDKGLFETFTEGVSDVLAPPLIAEELPGESQPQALVTEKKTELSDKQQQVIEDIASTGLSRQFVSDVATGKKPATQDIQSSIVNSLAENGIELDNLTDEQRENIGLMADVTTELFNNKNVQETLAKDPSKIIPIMNKFASELSTSGTITGGIKNLADSLAFGIGTEAAEAITGLFDDSGLDFKTRNAIVNTALGKFSKENPKTSLATTIGGFLLPGSFAAKTATASLARLGIKSATAGIALAGAGEGAISGIGDNLSFNDLFSIEGVKDISKKTLLGAALGTGIGKGGKLLKNTAKGKLSSGLTLASVLGAGGAGFDATNLDQKLLDRELTNSEVAMLAVGVPLGVALGGKGLKNTPNLLKQSAVKQQRSTFGVTDDILDSTAVKNKKLFEDTGALITGAGENRQINSAIQDAAQSKNFVIDNLENKALIDPTNIRNEVVKGTKNVIGETSEDLGKDLDAGLSAFKDALVKEERKVGDKFFNNLRKQTKDNIVPNRLIEDPDVASYVKRVQSNSSRNAGKSSADLDVLMEARRRANEDIMLGQLQKSSPNGLSIQENANLEKAVAVSEKIKNTLDGQFKGGFSEANKAFQEQIQKRFGLFSDEARGLLKFIDRDIKGDKLGKGLATKLLDGTSDKGFNQFLKIVDNISDPKIKNDLIKAKSEIVAKYVKEGIEGLRSNSSTVFDPSLKVYSRMEKLVGADKAKTLKGLLDRGNSALKLASDLDPNVRKQIKESGGTDVSSPTAATRTFLRTLGRVFKDPINFVKGKGAIEKNPTEFISAMLSDNPQKALEKFGLIDDPITNTYIEHFQTTLTAILSSKT